MSSYEKWDPQVPAAKNTAPLDLLPYFTAAIGVATVAACWLLVWWVWA